MPIAIVRLFSFQGPNITSPRPAVLLEVRADRDLGPALRNAIKDVGQQIGLVIAALNIHVRHVPPAFHIRATFATPTPELGKAAIHFILSGLQARETNTEWDEDEQLELLQERSRKESLPFAALQIIAEAERRGIPAFRRNRSALQLGYGKRGHAVNLDIPFDERRNGERLLQTVPWEQLGTIPIIATCGVENTEIIAHAIASAFPHLSIGIRNAAGFHESRELLSESNLDLAILDLAPLDLLRVGLPFEQCTVAGIGTMPTHLPQVHSASEIAQAMALPMLVATNHIVIAESEPLLKELTTYTPCPARAVAVEEITTAMANHAITLVATLTQWR